MFAWHTIQCLWSYKSKQTSQLEHPSVQITILERILFILDDAQFHTYFRVETSIGTAKNVILPNSNMGLCSVGEFQSHLQVQRQRVSGVTICFCCYSDS